MKLPLITLATGALAGWIGSSMILGSHNEGPMPQEAPETTRSVLSPRAGGTSEAIPLDFEALTLEGIESILVRLDDASESEIKHWLRQLNRRVFAGQDRQQVMHIIVAHWASKNPEAALAFAQDEDFTSLIHPILQQWARSDMKTAYEIALSVDAKGNQASRLIEGLDPEQMETYYEFLLEQDFDKRFPGMFGNVFSELYKANPEKAASDALALGMQQGGLFGWSNGIVNVMNRWVRDDPEAALRWARDQENPKAREYAMAQVAIRWIADDPVGGMERFWQDFSHEQRENILNEFHSLPPRDIDALLNWVDAHVESLDWNGKILTQMIGGLYHSDEPEKLAEILPRLDSGFSGLEDAVRNATSKWAQTDLDGLEQWMQTLEDEKLREATIQGWLKGVAHVDPLQALTHLEEMQINGDSGHVRSLLSTVFQKMRSEGRSVEEVMDQVPESLRDAATMSYASGNSYYYSGSSSRPGETMEFLQAQPAGSERDRALQFTVGHWAADEPQEAANWTGSLEESKHKEYAMRNLANTWVRFDPEAAIAWIEEQPSSPSRDLALQEIVKAAQNHAPEQALALAHTIADERKRHRFVQESLKNLARKDPDQASDLLSSSGLPPEAVTSLEAEIAQHRLFRELGEE